MTFQLHLDLNTLISGLVLLVVSVSLGGIKGIYRQLRTLNSRMTTVEGQVKAQDKICAIRHGEAVIIRGEE